MTIATTVLTNLPVQGEMLDENGHLTQQWRLFFQGLYIRIGGQAAPSNLALGSTTDTSSGAISSLTTATNSNTTNISNLTTTSNNNATTVSGLTTTSNNNATTVSNLSMATNSNTTAIATLNAAPGAVAPVTVTASPFTYRAIQKGALVISGGSLRRVEVTRDGTTFYLTGTLRGMFPLSTNDSIRVTYIAALVPVLTFFPT